VGEKRTGLTKPRSGRGPPGPGPEAPRRRPRGSRRRSVICEREENMVGQGEGSGNWRKLRKGRGE
jgi:hypothetical protein